MRYIFIAFAMILSHLTLASDQRQLSCLLEPNKTVKLGSASTGVVEKLLVERGDEVERGQLLVQLESGVEQAALQTQMARAAFAQRQLDRNKTMREDKLVSEFDYDELSTDLALAESAVNEMQQRLKRRQVLSPINGVVVSREISEGEYVNDEPLLMLAALDPLHAELVLEQSLYGSIASGDTVKIDISQSNEAVMGTVTVVDRVIDAASGTFGVRVAIPNHEGRIPAGLRCRANLKF